MLPVVLALFLGIIQFGFVFKDSLAMSSGVRAGGRIASAEPLKLSFARDAAAQVGNAMTAVSTGATATLYVFDPSTTGDPLTTCSSRCVRYVWNAGTTTFDATSSAWDQCAKDSTQVGVVLRVQQQGVTGLSFLGRTLTERSVFAFEPASTTAVCQ